VCGCERKCVRERGRLCLERESVFVCINDIEPERLYEWERERKKIESDGSIKRE
jgi:hypothetical protein